MADFASNFRFEGFSGLPPAPPGPLTVTQVTRLIRDALRAILPPAVSVVGQISNFRPTHSGHVWFTLKDDQSQLSCVLWADKARRLKFKPQDGLEVVAGGNIDVYANQGRYQLYVERLEPVGVGALELAFRQLYEQLNKEGLFETSHKQPLPRYPATVAIVTSPTGAAIRDIVRTILRRWPAIRLIVVPVRVQGEMAGEEIASAIARIGRLRGQLGVDLLIVGRGGGSIEDLWAFNEEVVARAIYACPIPVISAVGHERDTTIADLVADARAATPTHAGEMAVRVRNEVMAELDERAEQLGRRMLDRLQWHRLHLTALERTQGIADPARWLRQAWQGLDKSGWQVQSQMQRQVSRLSARLGDMRLRMERVHPNVQLTQARARLTEAAGRLHRARAALARLHADRLDATQAGLRRVSPLRRVETLGQQLAASVRGMELLLHRSLQGADRDLQALQVRLEASSPRQILKRGFTITRDAATGRFISAAAQVRPGMILSTETAAGQFRSIVESARHPRPPRPRGQRRSDPAQLSLPIEPPEPTSP